MAEEIRAVNPARAETRACITKALVKLTQEKALSSISVTELCQAAGVSRMAFYRNYRSKEEVSLLGSKRSSQTMRASPSRS